MSGSQVALKIISILVIILAIISVISGVVAFAYVASNDPTTTEVATTVKNVSFTYGEGAAAIGIFGIIGGIVDFIVGCLGLRGAKDPSKIGPFWVIALIGLVFEVVELILSLISMAQGNIPVDSLGFALVSPCIVAVCFFLANNIKKEGKQA